MECFINIKVMHLHEQGVSTFISVVSRQHGVADGDTSVRRFLQREGEQFHMDAEVECLQENHFSHSADASVSAS